MPTQNVAEWAGLQKIDNPLRAFAVRCSVVNQQSARHQKISRKKNPGSVVVKSQVGLVVPGRRNYVNSAATQIQVSNSIGPVSETVKRLNPFQIYRHDLNRRKRCELRIAGAMIHMPVGMCHQERQPFLCLV